MWKVNFWQQCTYMNPNYIKSKFFFLKLMPQNFHFASQSNIFYTLFYYLMSSLKMDFLLPAFFICFSANMAFFKANLSIFDKKSIVVDKLNQNYILIVSQKNSSSDNECNHFAMEIGASIPSLRY